MVSEFQPILLEDFRIEVPGFRLRRIALNQHMPRVERLSEHRHEFHQALLYLRGAGTQHISEDRLAVARGDWLVIPPGVPHRFSKEMTIRPVCLALDFETGEAIFESVRKKTIPPRSLAAVEQWLVQLHAARTKTKPETLAISSLILRIAALLEESLSRREPAEPGRMERRVQGVIREEGPESTPGIVARKLGLSLDHLNRALRVEAGVTVGGWIRKSRLDRATHLLQTTDLPVSAVASSIGIDDQNYFSRWFRKYTGQTPTAWRTAMR